MAKPTKPKEAKPKASVPEGGNGGGSGIDNMKLIIINAATTLAIGLIIIGSNYYFVNSSLDKVALNTQSVHEEDAAAEHDEDEIKHGLILDLGEFILNLSDPKERRYLKVNVAIELTKKATDPDPHAAPAGGGGHGHGSSAPDPMEIIKAEMDQYRPAVRDSIISVLSSKTPDELASITGKELAKEQIKEAVDAIFASQREVIRVSFGNFIIQ